MHGPVLRLIGEPVKPCTDTFPKQPPSADGGDGPRGCYKGDGYIMKERY